MAGPRSIKKAIRQSAGDISDRSTCAANSTATGSGIKSADLGKKAKFTITSRDSQELNKQGYEVKVDVKDKGNGTYWAEYTVPDDHFMRFTSSDSQPRTVQYTLSVCLVGAHIRGSPFVVKVTRHSPPTLTGMKNRFSSSLKFKS